MIKKIVLISVLLLIAALGFLFFKGTAKIADPSLMPEFDAAKAELQTKQFETRYERSKPSYEKNRRALFGDLHIHTSLSTDAFVMGVRALPEDVYRFAKGAVVEHAVGYPVQIDRPLDFVAVTDHAEYMGQARHNKVDVPTTRRTLSDLLRNGDAREITQAWIETTNAMRTQGFGVQQNNVVDKAVNRSAWQQTIDAAERHNEPGVFTSFIAYEWSADAGEIATHLHRNVIYKSSNVSALPFSSLESKRPEDLWAFLEKEESQGRVAFAIPHNPNASLGAMFKPSASDGKAMTAEYARKRRYYEPLTEILQIKGMSETHPLLSSEDEFASFGIAGLMPGQSPDLSQVKGSYARDALRVGMEMSHRVGFNPFVFGVIGSSDSHNADSPSDESKYSGKLPMMDGSAGLRTSAATLLPVGVNPANSWSSGGLAVVWAEENTRDALFAAMRRKETYATSGPRITVRLFAGWDFGPELLDRPDFIDQAYANGVPMGGVLSAQTDPAAPTFLVAASKDPFGANLDRVQIIKGWVDKHGDSHEKIFNIALSDGRVVEDGGAVPPLISTVDVSTATYKNSIGSVQLKAYWRDPEFDPLEEAFYYARVLEIPTPRWSTYDAVKLGTKPLYPEEIQERAITSAIWYRAN